MSTHHQRVRAVCKKVDKEGADRVRLGKPRYPGDDLCKAVHGNWVCYREGAHGGRHRALYGGKRQSWK